jgi:hypothetical protein
MGKADGERKAKKRRRLEDDGGRDENDAEEAPQAPEPPAASTAPEEHVEAGDGWAGDANGRRGRRGRSQVPPETLTYLEEVVAHFQTLVDDEERSLLVGNVLEEISGREVTVAGDAVCSRHVETLMSAASAPQLMAFLTSVSDVDGLFALVSKCVAALCCCARRCSPFRYALCTSAPRLPPSHHPAMSPHHHRQHHKTHR